MQRDEYSNFSPISHQKRTTKPLDLPKNSVYNQKFCKNRKKLQKSDVF
jgi:hypothetical protein